MKFLVLSGLVLFGLSFVSFGQTSTHGLRTVLLVGNSVSGTISFIDAESLVNLGEVDAIPDIEERLDFIYSHPIRRFIYERILDAQLVRHFEPSRGVRFVDDVFLSPDGNTLYVSRSNLGDVAAFDMRQYDHPILWRTTVPLYKADHAALSPDGRNIVVSAPAAGEAEIIDTTTGVIIGSFKTGILPHQNEYSSNGKYIYNGSLGFLSLPYALNGLKGSRQLTVADAKSFKVVRTYALPAGIRPSVLSNDGTTMYAQLSYFNGVIKYDLVKGEIASRVELPLSSFAVANYKTKDDYPHNSAHHGLAISQDGKKLCDVGTIDNNVSIIATANLKVLSTIDVGMIPYWATTVGDYCMVSLSGDNEVAVISYNTGREVAKVEVGKFPQRSRVGKISAKNLELLH